MHVKCEKCGAIISVPDGEKNPPKLCYKCKNKPKEVKAFQIPEITEDVTKNNEPEGIKDERFLVKKKVKEKKWKSS